MMSYLATLGINIAESAEFLSMPCSVIIASCKCNSECGFCPGFQTGKVGNYGIWTLLNARYGHAAIKLALLPWSHTKGLHFNA